MRVVVSSASHLRDEGQAELDRHLLIVSRFLERTVSNCPESEARCLTLLLRSAASGAAQALITQKDDLLSRAVTAKVILAKLDPEDDLRQLFAALSELNPNEPAGALIRWARNPKLLDAHEQVTYGTAMCWSGDSMRREAGKRNTLTLLDEAAPDRVRLGRLAFQALWAASTPIPERRLIGTGGARPSGAYQPLEQAPLAVLHSNPQGWPLVRH